jgi:hypothetical protein
LSSDKQPQEITSTLVFLQNVMQVSVLKKCLELSCLIFEQPHKSCILQKWEVTGS